MTWTVTNVNQGLGAHATCWDELNARLHDRHPLLDSAFINGLLGLPRTGPVVLCIEHLENHIVSMCLLTPGPLGRWSSFLPSQAQMGPTLLGKVDDLQGLIRALPGHVQAVDFLCIDPRFSKLHSTDGPHGEWTAQAVTVAVELTGDYAAYWKGRSSNLRDNLRRYLRRANADSAYLDSEVHSSPAAVALAIGRYAALEVQGWKGRERTSLGSSPEQLQFFRQVMAHFAAAGQAYVFELRHNNQLVASRLIIRQGRVAVILKTTFDESMSAIAPGRIQLQMVIQHAFAHWAGGLLEFYTSANDQQLSWASSQRMIGNLRVYRNGLTKRLTGAIRWMASLRHQLRRSGKESRKTVDSVLIASQPAEVDLMFQRMSDELESRNPEASLDWYACQCRAVLRRPDSARFVGLKRGQHAVALLPANIDPGLSRLDGGVGALSTFYTTLYEPLIGPECVVSDVIPLVRALVTEAGRPGVMTFGPMDPDSNGYRLLRQALRSCGYRVYEHMAHGNWFLPVTQTWAEYLATRHGTLRNTIRRMQKKLDAENARFEFVSQPEDADRAVAAYNQVYANSWKQSEPLPTFMSELARTCANRGWLRIGLVWIGDRPIAAQFWIVTKERAEIYKIAYDEAFKALTAGTVLTARMIERAIDIDGVSEIDYLVGDDKYKQQWMTHRRERWRLWAFHPFTKDGLARIVRMRASTVKSWWMKQRNIQSSQQEGAAQ